jgi:hypothetical protein
MAFYGKKYLVIGQYHNGDTLYLQCVNELGGQISTFPAAITNFYCELNLAILEVYGKTHFTFQGLKDVASILDNALASSPSLCRNVYSSMSPSH